ncbi:MAG TPA: hypothetical protein VGA65_04630 [Hyphomicrobium sp.]|jgi:hypothetical protein
MCDYSLEAYRTRPAREGEHYTTHRFPSGTVGFIAPGDTVTAICLAYDTKLNLDDIPQQVQQTVGVQASEPVTFTRLETALFQDGVRFANGAEISLQRLGTGVNAYVVDALLTPHLQRETA